jgi:hypothetical protein
MLVSVQAKSEGWSLSTNSVSKPRLSFAHRLYGMPVPRPGCNWRRLHLIVRPCNVGARAPPSAPTLSETAMGGHSCNPQCILVDEPIYWDAHAGSSESGPPLLLEAAHAWKTLESHRGAIRMRATRRQYLLRGSRATHAPHHGRTINIAAIRKLRQVKESQTSPAIIETRVRSREA